jgi:vancomycin resistance protein YoaR
VRRYIIAIAIAIPAVLVMLVVGAYAYDEIVTDDQISHGVSAEGIDLSRMTRSEAVAALNAYEAELAGDELDVIVDGHNRSILPSSVGFDIDEQAVVDEAMTVRRATNGFANFVKWFSTKTGTIDLAIEPTVDVEALDAVLSDWDRTAIDKPAYDGAVIVVNGVPAPEYPQPGLRIDHEQAIDLIRAAMSGDEAEPVEVPLDAIVPRVTDTDVDEAVALASEMVSTPVVLRPAGQTKGLTFSPAGLTSALRSEVVTNSPATVVPFLDEDVIAAIAAANSRDFEVPPVDASFVFNDETKEIIVIPSKVGRTIDLDAVPERVSTASVGTRGGTLPMKDGRAADLTTEMAEAMGPFGEVSSFTTFHPCCANRVVNIQLLADEIGGHWVLPGETFSINDTAGKRTEAEGYRRAGAIIGGIVTCCDSPINVGGGTSQFATTFYNAVFFGCYEDVFHQPHSIYFSRYPFIREATLGFPAPDVKFRNDSDSVIYIETSYTATSITVTFYGNNGGKDCESVRSGNTITRVMTHPDGSVTEQTWTWNYRPEATTTTTTSTTTTVAPPTTEPPPTTVPPDPEPEP